MVYLRINFDEELDFNLRPDEHRFPIISVGEENRLVVVVNSLPRSSLHFSESNTGTCLKMYLLNHNIQL